MLLETGCVLNLILWPVLHCVCLSVRWWKCSVSVFLCRVRKEEAARNTFHHLWRKVAAAQWLTPLIDAALIMIIACQSCCCFSFPNAPPSLFVSAVFHILAPPYAGVLQMFGRRPLTLCSLLAANQEPPLHYCSDTCWCDGLSGKLMLRCWKTCKWRTDRISLLWTTSKWILSRSEWRLSI